jgi:hypothetical protein
VVKIIDLSVLIGNYKSNVKRIIRILSVFFIVATPLLLITHSSAASSATMYLTPSSATVAIGNTLTVSIYEDSGAQDVNAAEANLTYNPNILQYSSVTSSSAFSISAATSGGGGTVTIDRGAIPPVTGAQIVATVTFIAKASGSSAINVSPSSKVLANSGPQANQNILTSTTGGNYTVPSPPPPPPPPPPPAPTPSPSPSPSPSPKPSPRPSPTPTPSPSPSPSPSPKPSPSPSPSSVTKDTTPPSISGVTVSDIRTTSALVSWNTNETATSQVDFGVTTNYELTNGNGLFVTNHKLELNYKLLNPDTVFHFRVKSVDAAGNVATSPDQTFTTKAGNAVLAVKVVDQNNNPVSGAKVAIGNSSSKTDRTGNATLNDLAVGTASLVVDYKGHKTTKSLEVDPPTGTPQSATVTIQSPRNYTSIVLFPTIALLVLAAGAYFMNRSGGPKLPFIGPGISDIPVVGGNSGPTLSPGSTVAPPPPPPTNSSQIKTVTPPPDTSKDAPPPTIVRPTIPPRG